MEGGERGRRGSRGTCGRSCWPVRGVEPEFHPPTAWHAWSSGGGDCAGRMPSSPPSPSRCHQPSLHVWEPCTGNITAKNPGAAAPALACKAVKLPDPCQLLGAPALAHGHEGQDAPGDAGQAPAPVQEREERAREHGGSGTRAWAPAAGARRHGPGFPEGGQVLSKAGPLMLWCCCAQLPMRGSRCLQALCSLIGWAPTDQGRVPTRSPVPAPAGSPSGWACPHRQRHWAWGPSSRARTHIIARLHRAPSAPQMFRFHTHVHDAEPCIPAWAGGLPCIQPRHACGDSSGTGQAPRLGALPRLPAAISKA